MVYALIVSLIVLAFENFIHRRERKDLYSRIMAKDLSEYSTATGTKRPGKMRSFIREKAKKLQEKEID